MENPRMRQSHGEGLLCRHGSLEKRVAPQGGRGEEEPQGRGERAKSRGRRQRRKREKQEGPDRAGAREIPSVISKRNAISGKRPKDKHTHVHTQKNERSESIVRMGLARERGHMEGPPLSRVLTL